MTNALTSLMVLMSLTAAAQASSAMHRLLDDSIFVAVVQATSAKYKAKCPLPTTPVANTNNPDGSTDLTVEIICSVDAGGFPIDVLTIDVKAHDDGITTDLESIDFTKVR